MDGMALIRAQRGLITTVAAACGITQGAVSQWKRVPAELLPKVEAATGIPRHELRPDICPPPGMDIGATIMGAVPTRGRAA